MPDKTYTYEDMLVELQNENKEENLDWRLLELFIEKRYGKDFDVLNTYFSSEELENIKMDFFLKYSDLAKERDMDLKVSMYKEKRYDFESALNSYYNALTTRLSVNKLDTDIFRKVLSEVTGAPVTQENRISLEDMETAIPIYERELEDLSEKLYGFEWSRVDPDKLWSTISSKKKSNIIPLEGFLEKLSSKRITNPSDNTKQQSLKTIIDDIYRSHGYGVSFCELASDKKKAFLSSDGVLFEYSLKDKKLSKILKLDAAVSTSKIMMIKEYDRRIFLSTGKYFIDYDRNARKVNIYPLAGVIDCEVSDENLILLHEDKVSVTEFDRFKAFPANYYKSVMKETLSKEVKSFLDSYMTALTDYPEYSRLKYLDLDPLKINIDILVDIRKNVLGLKYSDKRKLKRIERSFKKYMKKRYTHLEKWLESQLNSTIRNIKAFPSYFTSNLSSYEVHGKSTKIDFTGLFIQEGLAVVVSNSLSSKKTYFRGINLKGLNRDDINRGVKPSIKQKSIDFLVQPNIFTDKVKSFIRRDMGSITIVQDHPEGTDAAPSLVIGNPKRGMVSYVQPYENNVLWETIIDRSEYRLNFTNFVIDKKKRRIYGSSDRNRLFALNQDTGDILWRKKLRADITSNIVGVNTGEGFGIAGISDLDTLVCCIPSKEALWSSFFEDKVIYSIRAHSKGLIFSCKDGVGLYTLPEIGGLLNLIKGQDATNRWFYRYNKEISSYSHQIVHDDDLFAMYDDSFVHINIPEGRLVKEFELKKNRADYKLSFSLSRRDCKQNGNADHKPSDYDLVVRRDNHIDVYCLKHDKLIDTHSLEGGAINSAVEVLNGFAYYVTDEGAFMRTDIYQGKSECLEDSMFEKKPAFVRAYRSNNHLVFVDGFMMKSYKFDDNLKLQGNLDEVFCDGKD